MKIFYFLGANTPAFCCSVCDREKKVFIAKRPGLAVLQGSMESPLQSQLKSEKHRVS
jgi:hypothetical protein